MINSTKALQPDQIEAEIFKKFKMKGLLVGDEEAVRLMDETLESGHSQVISAGIKRQGLLFQFFGCERRRFYTSPSVCAR